MPLVHAKHKPDCGCDNRRCVKRRERAVLEAMKQQKRRREAVIAIACFGGIIVLSGLAVWLG